MSSKYVGKRIQRNEDPRLLTGQALFVDDVNIPGMLHAAFLRSDYAHARLKSIDATARATVRASSQFSPLKTWAMIGSPVLS